MEVLLAAVELLSKSPELFPSEKKIKKEPRQSESRRLPSIVLEESVSVSSTSTLETVKPVKIDGPDRFFGAEDYFRSVLSMFDTNKQQNLPTPDISDNTYLTFPQKLYLLISYDTNHCIEWCEDGSAFAILKKNYLVDFVIPKFFKQSDFRSFTRQINVYSFSRFRMNNVSDYCYRHPAFKQGDHQSLLVMTRRKPAFKRGADRRSLDKKKLKKQKIEGGETPEDFDDDSEHNDHDHDAEEEQLNHPFTTKDKLMASYYSTIMSSDCGVSH